MRRHWLPIGLAVTAMTTGSVAARADTPVDVAATGGEHPVPITEPAPASATSAGQSRLAIVVPLESDVEGLEILRDGTRVAATSYGLAVPVDAGTHVLVAQAPGRIPWFTQLRVAPGNTTVTVTVPRLNAQLGAPPKAPKPELIERDTGKTERTIGLVLGGAGLASVVAGAWLGFDDRASARDYRAQCSRGGCPYDWNDDSDRFSTQAVLGDAFLVLGFASCVGGAIFFLSAPSAPAEPRAAAFQLAPAVTPGGASFVASGKF